MVGMMLVVDGDIDVPCNDGYDAIVDDVGGGTLLSYLLDTVQSLRPTLLSPNV